MSKARDIANSTETLDVDGGTIKLDGNYPVGINNVALGDAALDSNVSGASNTAIGADALTANTAGNYSTAVGYQAAYNSSAGDITAVGAYALFNQTTQNADTAVGKYAGYFHNGGYYLTAVGQQAAYSNTTGANITAIGVSALHSNTTASNNTAVGYQAGYSTTTGGSNTYIGNYCGYAMTTGINNTILGRYSGNEGGLDIRTSNNNIVLSDGAGNPRLWSDGNGRFNLNRSGAYGARLAVQETAAANIVCDMLAADAGFYNQVLQLRCGRGATTGYNFIQAKNSGTTECFKVDGAGDVKNTNNSYGAISDEKLKENIVDSGSQWDDIKALTVRKYSMKADSLDAPNRLGVIAQELEVAGMSGLVSETPDRDDDGNDLGTVTKSVAYSILYMKAVKALQEAMNRIETLEARITALEAN